MAAETFGEKDAFFKVGKILGHGRKDKVHDAVLVNDKSVVKKNLA